MMSDQSLKAAKEAAAKVTAMLMASGQLRPSDLNKCRGKSTKSADLFVEEVVINDAPMSARNFLTRSFTQEEISKMSGASVSTRGRYMTQEEIEKNTSNDRPLYLHIQGMNQQDVKVAVGRIMHLIMEHTHRKNTHHHKNKGQRNGSGGSRHNDNDLTSPPPDSMGNGNENNCVPGEVEQIAYQQNVLREKVFLPATVGMHPIEIRMRLVGENNSNIKYILDETGASIFMRGIGSGFIEPSTGMESQEPLHFYLEHNNQEKFNEAKDLIVNLAQTILSELHQEHTQDHMQPHQIHQQHFQPNIQGQITINGNGIVHPQPVLTTHQIQHHNPQIVVSAVGQPMAPGIVPPQIGLQVNPLQVSQGTTQLLMAPQTVSAGHTLTATAMPGQQIQELTHTSVVPTTQLVQISVPSSGPNIMTQQLVQTSAGPQLVQLPPGTQIISTPEGPRLIALTPANSVSTAFVTPVIQTSSEQHAQLGIAIPQPMPQSVPQPVPPVSRGAEFTHSESYMYDAETNKLVSSAPVMLTTTPTSTFAYLHPPPPLEQEVSHQHLPPPTSAIAIEACQSHWLPSTNSVVFSQVTVPTSQMEIFSQAQGSQTQVTYVHTSLTNQPLDNYSTQTVSSPLPQSQPVMNIEQRRDWNMNSTVLPQLPVSHYSQDPAASGVSEIGRDPNVKECDAGSLGLANDGNRMSGLRSPTKGGSYMWAHYPQETDYLQRAPPSQDPVAGPYHRDTGGRFNHDSDDRPGMKASLEHLNQDVSSQGSRQPGRKSYSMGGFSGESKRRRSFKPKGEFRGGNRHGKRDIEDHLASAQSATRFGDQEMPRYYGELQQGAIGVDEGPAHPNFQHTLPPQPVCAPLEYSNEYPPLQQPLQQDEFGASRGPLAINPEVSFIGPPPPENQPPNPWQWGHAGTSYPPNLPMPHPNFSQRPALKNYESPWESGIPGVPAESARQRGPMEPMDHFFRPKLAKYRRF